ncbi:MAG: Lrp/AsnC family transcriptional regulator [Bacteroidetes bacterium]|nr:Lrp/AsnC family transcriptional regulator [Bacteroidota bacterium]
MERIDDIDARIVAMLQEHGRLKRNEIAEAVGLSVPAVSERMRKLEERGVITGYHAVVNSKRLHLDVTVFIRVSLDTSQHFNGFVERAMAHPEVLEVHSITGEGSHILKVRTRNTTTLERLLAQVQQWPGVRATSSSIVLSTFKETRAVPVVATTLHDTDTA